MKATIFAAIALATAAPIALGNIVYSLAALDNTSVSPSDDQTVPDFNDGSYYTFDLVATVTAPDSWLGVSAVAYLSGPAVFFQHPLGDDEPLPAWFPFCPAMEFDSYFTTPGGDQPYFGAGSPINE